MKDAVDLLEIRFEKNSSIVTRKVAGETILVPIVKRMGEQACLYTLDDSATFIWDRIDGRTTGQEISGALPDSYEVEASQAETDVRAFLGELQSIDAVQVASAEPVKN